MSKFEEQTDSNDSICPYCGHAFQVEAECFCEDAEQIETCENCGKKYFSYQVITIETVSKPDCTINGEEHKWGEAATLGGGKSYYECTECGKYKFVCKYAESGP